jgi:DNA-binding LacI/PurR family transcriptional regulator/DNA-binding transcriptional regulator YhcF (GntR family)
MTQKNLEYGGGFRLGVLQRAGIIQRMPVKMKRESSDLVIAQARQHLAARLGDTWRAGDRLPSVRELAQDLGVSHGTAQRAVRELVGHGFLVARPRLGVFVSSQFSDAQLRAVFSQHAPDQATSQRPLAGARIAVYFNDLATHMAPALDSLQTTLADQGCSFTREDYAEGPLYPLVRNPDADVLLLINPSSEVNLDVQKHQHVLILHSAATLVKLNTQRLDVVTLNQEQGAALAGQYLRQRGCASACFIGVGTHQRTSRTYEPSDPPYLPTSQVRLRGFEAGWGEPLPAQHQLYAGAYSPLSGATIARNYAALNPRPRGVFVASDDLAVGFISGLATLNLRMRRDYELVGFDGQRQLKQLAQGQVTSVEVPAALMGQHAAELLIDRAQHPDRPCRTLMVGCTLRGLP